MFTLRLLGGLALDRHDGRSAGRAAQKRRLALLAVLAIRPGARISRDRLLALLWPDSPTDEGRHRLSAALYDLRRAFGEEAFFAAADDVAVKRGAMECDVLAFERAVDAGDWESAVAQYRGPFLDGVHVGAGREFEEWADGWRSNLTRAYQRALEGLARMRAAAGDNLAAAEAWRRLAELDPLSDRVAGEFMRALEASGNRAGALRHADAHAERLRAELGVAPDAAIVMLAQAMRVRVEAGSAAGISAQAGPATGISAEAGAAAGISAQASRAGFPANAGDDARADSLPASPQISKADPVAGTARPPSTAIADRAAADREVAPENADAASGRAREPHTAQATARRRPRLLAGTLAGVVGIAAATTLLNGRAASSAARASSPVPASVLESTPAARAAYIEAEAHYRAGRYSDAIPAFQRAAVADTALLYAQYRLALATIWADAPNTSPDPYERRVSAALGRIPEYDALLMRGYEAWRAGEATIAETLYRRAATERPTDDEAWMQLGETHFHYNPASGRDIRHARASFERVLQLDSSHYGARWHIALLDALDDNDDAFLQHTQRLLALRPDSPRALELNMLRASARRDTIELQQLLARLQRADESLLIGIAWRAAVYLGDLATASRLFEFLAQPERNPYTRRFAVSSLFFLDLARGRVDAAIGRLPELRSLSRAGARPEYATTLLLAFGFVAEPERARQLARHALAELQDVDGRVTERAYYTAWLYGSVGDWLAVEQTAAEFGSADTNATGGWHESVVSAALAGMIALHNGRPADALESLAPSLHGTWFGTAALEPREAEVLERWLLADALLQLGRLTEADTWLAGMSEHAVHELALLGPVLLRRAQIAESTGNTAAAVKHYTRFVELWRDADPALRPRVDAARQKLAVLARSH